MRGEYEVDQVLKLDATFYIWLDLRACAKNQTYHSITRELLEFTSIRAFRAIRAHHLFQL